MKIFIRTGTEQLMYFLILHFRRDVNIVFFLLDDFPGVWIYSDFGESPKRKNTTKHVLLKFIYENKSKIRPAIYA
jgi:hypothetical protein